MWKVPIIGWELEDFILLLIALSFVINVVQGNSPNEFIKDVFWGDSFPIISEILGFFSLFGSTISSIAQGIETVILILYNPIKLFYVLKTLWLFTVRNEMRNMAVNRI